MKDTGSRNSAISRDRGAQIALIVLLSLLEAYTVAIFVVGTIETQTYYFEAYDARLNPAHIISLVVLGVFFFYLVAYFFLRVKSPRSVAVAVRTDVVVFSTFAIIMIILGAVTLGITPLDMATYTGTLTAIFGLAWAGFLLIIVLFQAIYASVHHKHGGWRRRFATAISGSTTGDVELAAMQSKSGRSSTNERSDASPLPY